MWALFNHFIIEYSNCKMPRNSLLNEKGQISAYKVERKSVSFIAREMSWCRAVRRNYLKDPESYGSRKRPCRPPKTTIASRCQLFQEAFKGQSSSKYLQKLKIYPSLQEEFVNFSMDRQISYIKTGRQPLPCFNC